MVRKTKNRRDLSEKRKNKKRVTIKRRRGGKKHGDWKTGFWSEEPTIHAKFKTTGKTGKSECGYSLYWNYHYQEEDDSIPLEMPKNGKKKPIQKTELLQLFTDSEATDLKDKTKTKTKTKTETETETETENKKYRDCALPEKEVLKFLEENTDFQDKVKEGKQTVEDIVEANRKQKEKIKELLSYNPEKIEKKSEYIVGKHKEIKEYLLKNKK